MKKKLLTLLIALILTCSLLIGCGASDSPETPSTSSESVSKTSTTDTPESVEEPTTDTTETIDEASNTNTQESSEENTDANTEKVIDDTKEDLPTIPETSTPDSTKEPVPLPEPVAVYTYTDMVQTMYAKSTVNVRDLPDTSGNKLGSLAPSQEVAVTGTCNETGWYKIDYNGSVAFVSNEYLIAEKPVAPAKTTSSGGMSRNIADYRQISSLSELTPSAGWTADFAGFCATYKSIPKVAYTYNGVTILLYDYTWNDGYGDWCVFYDFSRQHTTSPWSRNYFSSVHSIIDAGGYETYSFNLDGSKVYTWHPISDYQVY